MVPIVDDGRDIERQDPTRVGDIADIDVEDHTVALAYACQKTTE